jgi:hypothetical protein
MEEQSNPNHIKAIITTLNQALEGVVVNVGALPKKRRK